MYRDDLVLSFKGLRTYVQGADMLNVVGAVVVERFACQITDFNFAIHRMTDKNLSLELIKSDLPVDLEGGIATMSFSAQQSAWQGRLREKASQPVKRVPFDEEAVNHACVLNMSDTSIQLIQESPFTPIETLVSMTKALHLEVLPVGAGQWVFCRWSSGTWPLPQNLRGVRVCLKQKIGMRLTRSTITFDERPLGHIYFSARSVK